jgi:hypothetical protein
MELLLLLVGTAFIAVIGIAVGMLLAPRFDRWAAPPERNQKDEDAMDTDADDH